MMSAIIRPADLAQYLNRPDTRIIDATYPADVASFNKMRIGNAAHFDIDAIADRTTPLPHMLPSADDFAAAIGAMGIGNDDMVVVYDRSGMVMAAARAWWMFRCFGHKKIMVLDGGLPAWLTAGQPVTTGTPAPATTPAHYQAQIQPELVCNRQQVMDSLNRDDTLIVDARPQERFSGLAAEPRPGMRVGHIPGSLNIPYPELIDPAIGTLRRNHPQVLALAAQVEIPRIITTCGSGVTACLLALALYEAGRRDAAVYDGSWAEWGSESANMPIES